jgi:hypothetical protein
MLCLKVKKLEMNIDLSKRWASCFFLVIRSCSKTGNAAIFLRLCCLNPFSGAGVASSGIIWRSLCRKYIPLKRQKKVRKLGLTHMYTVYVHLSVVNGFNSHTPPPPKSLEEFIEILYIIYSCRITYIIYCVLLSLWRAFSEGEHR